MSFENPKLKTGRRKRRTAGRISKSFLAALVLMAAPLSATFAAVLNSPSQTAINAAIAAPLIRYNRASSGGAYTNGAFFGGASIILATASHVGNTSADARLLQQIRYTLTGGNEICANGGYPAQHELHATGMFAIAKQTPRIWNLLTATEKTRIDLLMKASLVACAFTTSNNNPYILAGTQQYTLNADPNLSRDWNPNYREGMIGGMLVGMVYFGGPVAAGTILNTYNHAQFVAALNANGFPNTYEIFNWKAANPSSLAPTGTMIQNAVKNYQYYGSTLTDYTGIYQSLVNNTYGKNVNAGLNGGAGIGGAGKIASGAAALPNPGVLGMLKEFDSADANGARSSLHYAYDGFRPHQTNQVVLIIGGYLQKGGSIANAAAARINIGNTDLWYKIEKGYIGYAKGVSQGLAGIDFSIQQGFPYVRSLWEDVLFPYHFSAPDPNLDTDGDGTTDATEILLGLDPANGSSRFAAGIAAGVLHWPSAAGLGFTVQRSISQTGIVWVNIATVVGTAGSASFTDPSPPAGRALYRVALNP